MEWEGDNSLEIFSCIFVLIGTDIYEQLSDARVTEWNVLTRSLILSQADNSWRGASPKEVGHVYKTMIVYQWVTGASRPDSDQWGPRMMGKKDLEIFALVLSLAVKDTWIWGALKMDLRNH